MIFDYKRFIQAQPKIPDNNQIDAFTYKFIDYWQEKLGWDFNYVQFNQYKDLRLLLTAYNLSLDNKEYTTKKGLFLTGRPGCGKTTLCYAISESCQIDIITANEIEEDIIKTDEISISRYVGKNGLIIDDLGAERNIKKYGNEPPLKQFLYRLYDFWKIKNNPIICNSNYNMEQNHTNWIAKIYGTRVASRFYEMFTSIYFLNEDLRNKY